MHHLGIETDDLETLVGHMKTKGFTFTNAIKDYGTWKYIMAEGPDNILLELFQILNGEVMEGQYEGFSSF